ncbi:ATP-binding protein [Brevibacillus fluminis]|uniref:ATP-binding protein n=1 Tax=Brevibacillus fluminis TaxID=511487 RepID=UPI0016056390|nr:ATP-binding protein [Brevibacillus fluminis]
MTQTDIELLKKKVLQLEKSVYLLTQQVYSTNEYSSFNTSLQELKFFDFNTEVLRYVIQWIDKFTTSDLQPPLGIYINGPFGVGKTFIMEALVNQLSSLNIPSALVSVPDMYRKLKDTFNKGTTEAFVTYLKTVPVLILDDIGAENVSPWGRDEILGPLLSFRARRNFPTLFTSNYNLEELYDHFLGTEPTNKSHMQARKIMELITPYVTCFELSGPNMRIEVL